MISIRTVPQRQSDLFPVLLSAHRAFLMPESLNKYNENGIKSNVSNCIIN